MNLCLIRRVALLGLSCLVLMISVSLVNAQTWCSTRAVDVTYLNTDDVEDSSGWHVFFRDDTDLGNLGPQEYYFYYRGEYVGPDVLQLEGFNSERDQWQAQIKGGWIAGTDNQFGLPNPFKGKYRFWMKNSWRVDYVC